jgi:transposase
VRALRSQQRQERDAHIRRLLADGGSIKGAARKAGVDVKTVRRLLRSKTARQARPSKLDPYKPVIQKLVCEDGLSVVLVLKQLRALGYAGGRSILKTFVRKIRKQPVRRAHLRFETAPGVQGQVDLSFYQVLIAAAPADVVCFSFVLGYSRWQYIRFSLHADAHFVCLGHVLAFEAAGGVPEEILYDRMKQIVLESYRNHIVMHPLFNALRLHYRAFRAVALPPGYKEGKGKVENPFRYVEGNFLREHRRAGFASLADLNEKARLWLRHTAWQRDHGTTHQAPADRLDEERPHLKPLPVRPFEAAEVEERIVGDDFCVAWLSNRYSVSPTLVGHSVKVRVLDGRLEVKVGDDVVAAHALRETQHQRYILPEHEAEFRERSQSRHVLREQFHRLGPAAKDFEDGLIAEHRGAAGYHISRILGLAERVGGPRVAEALRHAVRFGAFDYNAVARIVEGKTDKPAIAVAPPGPLPQRIHEFLRGAGDHQRSLRHYQKLIEKLKRKREEPDDGQ